MSTSDGDDGSQADVEPLPACDEEERSVRLPETEAKGSGAGEQEEEEKEEEGLSFEGSDLTAAGRLEAERWQAQMSDGGGSDSETEEETTVVDATPPIEPLDPFKTFEDEDDLLRMAGVIDTWSSGLKKQLASEFQSVKERLCLISRGAVANHHSELTARERSLRDQLAALRGELAARRREERRQERLAERLGSEVARQKERVRLASRFGDWRVVREREKREQFCMAIAERHYQRALKRRVFRAWASSLATSLTGMLERRCRQRAEEVCARLASEHEEKVQAINQQLDISRTELSAALSSQAAIREEVRAALVRGVSALNSDPKKTMAPPAAVFHKEEEQKEKEPEALEDDEDDRATYTLSDESWEKEKEKVIIATAPQRRVTTGNLLRSQPLSREPRSSNRHVNGPAVGRGAVFHHDLPPGFHRPIAGQEPFEAAPVRPRNRSPVASVLVERQHAVNKRTVAPAMHGAGGRRLKT